MQGCLQTSLVTLNEDLQLVKWQKQYNSMWTKQLSTCVVKSTDIFATYRVWDPRWSVMKYKGHTENDCVV